MNNQRVLAKYEGKSGANHLVWWLQYLIGSKVGDAPGIIETVASIVCFQIIDDGDDLIAIAVVDTEISRVPGVDLLSPQETPE